MAKIKSNDTVLTTLGRPKEKLNEMIQKKAYDLYLKRGRKSGSELSDWFEAEKLVKDEVRK